MKPRNKIQPLPFVLPALFVYILTVIIPILWSMGYSLFSWNGIGDMKFIGLENYVRMFQDETFREAVVNNLKFVVLGSLFQLCAGLILAGISFFMMDSGLNFCSNAQITINSKHFHMSPLFSSFQFHREFTTPSAVSINGRCQIILFRSCFLERIT